MLPNDTVLNSDASTSLRLYHPWLTEIQTQEATIITPWNW